MNKVFNVASFLFNVLNLRTVQILKIQQPLSMHVHFIFSFLLQ